MRYRFPYVGADLREPVIQPGISEHCETTDAGESRDIPIYFSSFSPGTHSSLLTEGRLRLSKPGCLVLRRGAWFTRPNTVTHPGTNRA